MKQISRRSFLAQSSLAAGAGLTARCVGSRAWAAPAGVSDAVRIGIIGLGNKGLGHLRQLARRSDVRIAALCDVDPARIGRAMQELPSPQIAPFTTTEARQVFERADVDAVMIVTGNHWHALHAIWACQAGKDVYVEKPMTHTVWEGRKLIEAAAKYRRIVQVGTQYRSEVGFTEAIAWLRSGHLGKISHVHCLYFDLRPSIGRRLPWYPGDLNYDVFCGPTPLMPLERDKLHYDWHWSWSTGNGDLGNNGVHMLDGALQVLGRIAPPRRVLSLGGRFVVNDAGETPNTQLAVYDFPEFPVIFEHRALPAKPGATFMDNVAGKRGGLIVYCEGGRLTGMTGSIAYDRDGREIRKFAGEGGGGHVGNFLGAVRSRRKQDLAATVEIGHASASICHFGNIAYRSGSRAGAADVTRALERMPAAAEIGRNLLTHLGVHAIDLTKRPLKLGPWLDIDAPTDGIAGISTGDEAALARARYLLRETQRPPYTIPENV